MIRTLQKKFVVTAMIAVSVLLLVVLGALNIFNAVSNTRQTENLLDELGRQNMMSAFGEDREAPPPREDSGSFEQRLPESIRRRRGFLEEPVDDNARMSALYFIVELSESCKVVRTDVSHIASVTEDEAAEMALSLDVDRDCGTLGNYRYKIFSTPEDGYKVVFLDSSTRHSSVMRVLLLSVLLGSLSWLLMLALVMALSRRAIRPIAENMERQRQFVTDAGHELKTPVAIIIANVDAMELRTGENKYSRNIRAQAARLGDLVRNLLTLARVDEYSVLERPEQIDFSALCGELFPTFREPAELKQIRFRTELTDGLGVTGDRNLLSQLCSILADNAVKYCPEGGEIRVRLWQDARRVTLRISNTVDEVPDLDRLFDRFYRADSSRNQKSGGFGIGLSAAQTIARLHKAELTADCAGDASEIRFTVRFPA
ncbi:MAG: HAMP domain-containing histidine kinase [Oscillospiraceae bacterium]|nr:HAMP domain-containing histidine kinase [Oscillospiraceae bacterium]